MEAAVSPADFFFILTYIFLLWGMFQAVFSRRLNLELWQKGVVVAIAVVGIAIAIVLSTAKPAEQPAARLDFGYEAENSSRAAIPGFPLQSSVLALFPMTQTLDLPVFNLPDMTSSLMDVVTQSTPPPEPPSQAPEWAISLEQQLKPLELPINWFYLLCDVLLLVLATTLLLAFWEGDFPNLGG